MDLTPPRIVDTLLEAPVVPGFSRIGYEVRRRVADWKPLSAYDLTGRAVLVTGGTSGLGRAAAYDLASMGAEVVIVGRDSKRNQAVVKDLVAETGSTAIHELAADMGELNDVRRLADLVADHDHGSDAKLDTIIHNAGALDAERTMTGDGLETTIAVHVVGPFLLTSLLLGRLADDAPARVITMSSGGMYAQGLNLTMLETATDAEQPGYDGTTQYALAKRAQVTLNEEWAARTPGSGVHFHAVHPGWADTAGVRSSLPRFAQITGPLLRSPEQGADTAVWLTADPEALRTNGLFWHDRRPRPIHRLPTTGSSDTTERRQRLWHWVLDRAGLTSDPTASYR